MNKKLLTAVCMFISLIACQKETVAPEEGGTAFSIEANLNPFENQSELDTKAGADAVVRLNWTAGDKISVINMTTGKALGGDLTAQQSGPSSVFSGSLVGSISRGDRLAFLYPSQNYSVEQTFESATIDLSSQAGSSRIPLVVCAYMDYTESGTHNLQLTFEYLMSYFQLNLDYLPESTFLTNVRFYDMGARATLSVNDDRTGFASAAQDGIIKVESPSLASNAKGAKAIYIAGFASPSQSAREVRVKASDNSYKTTWTGAALSVGKFYTSIINRFQQFDEPDDSIPNYIDEYGLDRGAGIGIVEEVNGVSRTVVWAPVNLGYSDSYPFGKLYQWGRKAGQGYGYANANDEAGNMVTVEGSPKEPGMPFMSPDAGTFYTSVNSSDWYAATSADQFKVDWNEIEETEYVGNPCPDGWRVPTRSELGGLYANKSSWTSKDSQNGYYFRGSVSSLPDASSLFLPAAGCRNYYDGNGGSRGDYGCYWSSTRNGGYPCELSFTSSGVNIYGTGCANGYSVRCVLSVGPLPGVSTTAVTKVGSSYAILGGDIVSDGGYAISSKGLVWGTSSTLTLTNCAGYSDEGPNSASFESYMTSLESKTTYYVRAYATNSKGTSYGNTVKVTTTDVERYIDEYGFDRGDAFTILESVNGKRKAVVWAPVNLGYSDSYPYGKLYQWGRKAGHGYGVPNRNDEAGNMVTVTTSTATSGSPLVNPDAGTFYTWVNSTTMDWYAVTIDDQFSTDWNEIEETDYVGNPCPNGWRIPTSYELEGLNANRSSWTSKNGQNGYYFKGLSESLPDASSLFLSAAGRRESDLSYYRGGDGYYWSSTPNGHSAYGFSFGSSYGKVNYDYRSYGLSVRCVLE